MSFSDVAENAILALIFNATTWANYAKDATSSPESAFDLALATADPGDTGTMSTNEATYSGYTRKTIGRFVGAFTVPSGGSVSFGVDIDFPFSGAAGTTITHSQIGKTGGGAADVMVNGAIVPNISIPGAGIIPRLTTGSTITLS